MSLSATIYRLARERLAALQPATYRRFVAAVLITNIGNGMQFIANTWLVLDLTHRASMVPLLLLTTALPGLAFGPVIGVAIDRFDRRMLYAVTDIASAVALAVAAALVATGEIRTWELFCLVFLLGLTEQISTPTGTTLVREIVPIDRLLDANSTNGVAVQLGTVTGAALGGILIAAFSLTTVLLVNLASFLLSALLIIGVRAGRLAERADSKPSGWRATLRHSALGVRYLREHPALVPTYLMLMMMFATLYMLNSLLPPFARDVLRVGPAGLGYIDAMFAVGAIAGGVALPLLCARVNRDRVAALAIVLLGGLLVGFAFSSGLLIPMLLYVTIGLNYQSFQIFRTKVQEKVPLDLQGRVFSLIIIGVGLARLTVYGLLGILASVGSLRLVYLAWGAALIAVSSFFGVRAVTRRAPSSAAVPQQETVPQQENMRKTVPTQRPALIVLGGLAVAWNQRYLEAAQQRQLAVLLLDRPGTIADSIGQAWRDGLPSLAAVAEIGQAAPADLAAVVDQASAWSRDYLVRGICCIREDYVTPAAVVADLLGLPSPGLRAARVCRDKYLQRRYLAGWSPDMSLVTPERQAEIASTWSRFPAVVKPTGRLGSSGVRLVADPAGLRACLANDFPAETVLLEERVHGLEFSVESLSHEGAVCYAGITQKRTTELNSDFFVELGHTTPSPDLAGQPAQRLLATHREVLARIGFRTGMAHAEYRVGASGQITLMEIAARPPGDSIMGLHWLACGAHLEDGVVGLAVGEAVCQPPPSRFARQVYLPHRPGLLSGLSVAPSLGVVPQWFRPGEVCAQLDSCGTPDDPPAVRCVVALKPAGSALGPLRESGDRAAMFVIDAPTPRQLDDLEATCREAITLRVDS